MENADVPQLEAPLDLDEGPNIRLLGFGPHISNGVIKEELQVSRGPVDESACITALESWRPTQWQKLKMLTLLKVRTVLRMHCSSYNNR